jgi:hypothetical protein
MSSLSEGSDIKNLNDIVYHVIVSIEGGSIIARDVGGNVISSGVAGTDDSRVITEAITFVPDNGNVLISNGEYLLSADTQFYLDEGDLNPFWICIPILGNKNVHIFGYGAGITVLKLKPNQFSVGHPVAMMLNRAISLNPGFTAFTVANMTFDGNRDNQEQWYKDGASLILTGSPRSGGNYYNLEFKNSYGTGLYLGNNGMGSESHSSITNVVARDCSLEGILLDTAQDTVVSDCVFERCRTGLTIHGNNDYQTRTKDRIVVKDISCIASPLTIWCINDLQMSSVNMDCTASPNAYGLLIHSSIGVHIKESFFKSDRNKASSYGGASYIDAGIDGPTAATLENCVLDGYYALHVLGSATATLRGGAVNASYACAYLRGIDPSTAMATLIGTVFIPAKHTIDCAPGTSINIMYCYSSSIGSMIVEGTLNNQGSYGFGLPDV